MAKYVALLRGIAPLNPNMHQSKLCGVLEGLGLKNVRGVISSGNVVFESNTKGVAALEARIEAAWPKELGFTSTTIIRSQRQLLDFVAHDPFRQAAENPDNYLLVTFFKQPQKIDFKLPYQPEGKPFVLVAGYPQEICTASDLSRSKTPDTMTWLEKQFGKQITSRTWKTVHRILGKMDSGQ
jgi:uncharacterized protein (DUF1697 family)